MSKPFFSDGGAPATATLSNEQKLVVNIINSSPGTTTSGEGAESIAAATEEVHSDVSSDDKQDQTKRKRRKWNRTAFARNSKSKQKKSSSTSLLTGIDSINDECDGLDDFANLIALTRSNSLDLEEPETSSTTTSLDIHHHHQNNHQVRSYGLNTISTSSTTPAENRGGCLQQSAASSSSSLSVADQLHVEDLNLLSVEEQELLQSIQAVSLDCGASDAADMNLNMKNIHLGPSDLVSEVTDGLLISGQEKKSLSDKNNPILLEDALISSASEMSLHSKDCRKKRNNVGTPVRAPPSASEIEKLACEFSSSLLTSSVNLPGAVDLVLDDDDELRLPVSGFPNQSTISIDLPENVLVSDGETVDDDKSVDGELITTPFILLLRSVGCHHAL